MERDLQKYAFVFKTFSLKKESFLEVVNWKRKSDRDEEENLACKRRKGEKVFKI